MPRNSDMGACVWVLIRPGAIMRVGAVQPLLGLEAPVDLGARPDGHDALAAHRHGAVLDDAARGVHGDDVARAPDPVGRFGGQRRRHSEQEEATR